MSDTSAREEIHSDLGSFGEKAFRLLQLEQRLEACDRLYQAEIAQLRTELSLLAADWIREYHHQRRTQPEEKPYP